MGNRRRRLAWIITLGVVLLLLAAQVVAARGPREAAVWCTQGGEDTTAVRTATQFTVNGTGFKRRAHLRVCVDYDCVAERADEDGNFHAGRTVHEPGTHSIKVFEMNKPYTKGKLKAITSVKVSDP